MTDSLPTANTNLLIPIVAPAAHPPISLDQNPAAVYLASLGDGSRRTMRMALNTIGEPLDVSEALDSDANSIRGISEQN